jgi:repressor LexA
MISATLTKKQKDVLDYVKEYMSQNTIAPSLDEIRKHFGFVSVSTAHYHLEKLKAGGFLDRAIGRARAIELQPFDFVGMSVSGDMLGVEFVSIPLLGSANCGPAELLAEDNILGYVSVRKSLVHKKSGIFAVRAVGKSLNRANVKGKSIEEGDIVLIDGEDRAARNGDYVLSIIDGAANLKKYTVEKGQVMLVSESTEKFKPIFVMEGDNWVVNGKIIAVVKQ